MQLSFSRNSTEVRKAQKHKIRISYTDQLGHLKKKDIQRMIKKYTQKLKSIFYTILSQFEEAL
jgi:2-hydroxy-3-keto-5-methylthiopentenyl-1-phosphate phosphatase